MHIIGAVKDDHEKRGWRRPRIAGDALDSTPSKPSVTDKFTTGVLVFSGGTRVTVTIAHNHIFKNKIGIWLSKPVKASGLSTNTYSQVTIPVSAGH